MRAMQISLLLGILCIFYVKGVPVLKENQNLLVVGDGNEVNAGEFPWQVSLRSSLKYLLFCGGIIIDHRTILTTAACAELASPYTTTVMAGNVNLNTTNDALKSQQAVIVSSVHIHPNYAENTDYSNDIAILKVNPALQMTKYVAPIPTLYDSNTVSAEYGIISGWGTKREEEISQQEKLQKATMKLIHSNQECQNLVDNQESLLAPVLVEDSMICIANPGSSSTAVDSCTGDQGGPLIIYDGDGAPVLLGLVSFGIGCGRPNMPSFCTRVSPFIDYIRQYQETKSDDQIA